jgi:hypothetical protein
MVKMPDEEIRLGQWLMPIILATQKAEIGRTGDQD